MYSQIFGIMAYIENNLNGAIADNNIGYELQLVPIESLTYSYPDTDKYKHDTSIHFQALTETREPFTTLEDKATLQFHIYIVARNDTQENLTEKVFRYSDCIKAIVKNDYSMGSILTSSFIQSYHYYDGIEGSPNIKVCEITLEVEYID